MPKIAYQTQRFSKSSMKLIETANDIIAEYQNQGFDLTLRQLYYQFVSRDIIANRQSEYKRLGSVINDARLAGLIDWEAIVDRTRTLRKNSHWDSPREIVETAAKQYQIDKWQNQEHHIEVWIEKDALIGVIEKVCQDLDIAYFSCRGYTSQSEMWEAAQRLIGYGAREGKEPIIIHLGDHDPSGLDMTRDIRDRFRLFTERFDVPVRIRRIALNMDQIENYGPPPNPAKITDTRADSYIAKHGDESWELDALEPTVLAKLIEDTVNEYRDNDKWQEMVNLEIDHKQKLAAVVENLAE